MLPTHTHAHAHRLKHRLTHAYTHTHTCIHALTLTLKRSLTRTHVSAHTGSHLRSGTYTAVTCSRALSHTHTCTRSHTRMNLHQDLIDSVFPYSLVVTRFLRRSIRSDPRRACVSPRSSGHSWNCGCGKFVLVYEIVSQGRRWTVCNSVRLLRSEDACVAPGNGDFTEKHLTGLRSASGAKWSWWSHLEAFRGSHQSEEASEEPLDDHIQPPSSVFILDFFFFLEHRYTPHTGVWRRQSPDWSLPLVSKDDNKS